MIGNQLALIKREIWEHRSIYVTPLVIASIVILGTLATIVFASGFAERLDVAIFGATEIAGDFRLRAILSGFFLGTVSLFVFALIVLIVFYSLDSLYAERKDKSILFWRSLPVTDAETVISKLLTALIVIPLATFVVIVGAHIVNLLITSIWISAKGGDGGQLIWGSASFIRDWLAVLTMMAAGMIWISPFVGWFLFVSAFTKRSPFLMAFLPLALIPLIEWIFLRSNYFFESVLTRLGNIPLSRKVDIREFLGEDGPVIDGEVLDLLAHLDLLKFVTSPSVWMGVVVCGLLTTAAIYVRRFRGEG